MRSIALCVATIFVFGRFCAETLRWIICYRVPSEREVASHICLVENYICDTVASQEGEVMVKSAFICAYRSRLTFCYQPSLANIGRWDAVRLILKSARIRYWAFRCFNQSKRHITAWNLAYMKIPESLRNEMRLKSLLVIGVVYLQDKTQFVGGVCDNDTHNPVVRFTVFASLSFKRGISSNHSCCTCNRWLWSVRTCCADLYITTNHPSNNYTIIGTGFSQLSLILLRLIVVLSSYR